MANKDRGLHIDIKKLHSNFIATFKEDIKIKLRAYEMDETTASEFYTDEDRKFIKRLKEVLYETEKRNT